VFVVDMQHGHSVLGQMEEQVKETVDLSVPPKPLKQSLIQGGMRIS